MLVTSGVRVAGRCVHGGVYMEGCTRGCTTGVFTAVYCRLLPFLPFLLVSDVSARPGGVRTSLLVLAVSGRPCSTAFDAFTLFSPFTLLRLLTALGVE